MRKTPDAMREHGRSIWRCIDTARPCVSKEMSKSSKVFVNTQELEARVQRNGYQRDRQSLEARRLLNGNYLVIGITGDRMFLAETTDGLFHRRNGRNVVRIHNDDRYPRRNPYSRHRVIEYLEYLIDTMLQLDKNRLSNGNYLTTERLAIGESDDCRYFIIETTDGVFDGQDKRNFVKFHGEWEWSAREAWGRHAAIIAEDARLELAVIKRIDERQVAQAKKKASAA
ncbi:MULTISPECIES: hypothetical protein [Acetobacter]|uniref:hypothetical protein n=1 Tax=Acetobacter TaxID=434 RepID=UPI00376FD3EB